MIDPLAEVVTLLQPSAPFSKVVSAAGAWQVDRTESGRPFYSLAVEGTYRLAVEGREPLVLSAGDFVLIPAAYRFTVSSLEPPSTGDRHRVTQLPGETRLGDPDAPAEVRMLVGHFVFGSSDASLLVSLLPDLVRVHGESRLATLVQLITDEARAQRPAREVIVARLLEVLLIEALRATPGPSAPPGLLRGLADERIAAALRRIHESPTDAWTIAELAKVAALSRSAFFDRFVRAMGVAPMEYLLSWRMALAKDLLRRGDGGIAEIAERVGYRSASAFSVAFTRSVGVPPSQYAAGRQDPVTADI